MKRIKNNYLIVPIVVLIIILLLVKLGVINLRSLVGENSESIHFNLITVNAVFAGFLFTAITFFIGVNTTKTIETLERIDYMDNVYRNLNLGFIASLISIILSLISIFILPTTASLELVRNSITIGYIINTFIPSLVLVSLIYTIIKFLIALRHLNFIIGSIRRKSKINAPSKESVDETLKRIK